MADPVRLGDVLALRLQLLDAMCRCGHSLSKHLCGGTCIAVDRVGGMPILVDCACHLYREVKCEP